MLSKRTAQRFPASTIRIPCPMKKKGIRVVVRYISFHITDKLKILELHRKVLHRLSIYESQEGFDILQPLKTDKISCYNSHMDYQPYAIPVSIKGIVFEDGGVWLRKNERNEWELPGGKLDPGEQPEGTLVRELKEELGFKVKAKEIINAHLYAVHRSPDEKHGVMVISYLCVVIEKVGEFELHGEAGRAEFKKFPIADVREIKMPEFYKEAILKAWTIK